MEGSFKGIFTSLERIVEGDIITKNPAGQNTENFMNFKVSSKGVKIQALYFCLFTPCVLCQWSPGVLFGTCIATTRRGGTHTLNNTVVISF